MNQTEINTIRKKHEKCLCGEEGGERTDLRHADLAGADLRGAFLRDTDLTGAVLMDADLRDAFLKGANLRDADLRDTDLTGAVLMDADLRDAKGIVRLPVGDPRDYDCVAVLHRSGWMIAAGCRWFTVSEAREHWGKSYEGERSIGDRYLAGLDWLDKFEIPEDWRE